MALTVVRETDAGIIVRGSRLLATLGPIADELAVYHAGNHRVGADAQRQAFAFAIPCDTPGLTFLCRESFDLGRSRFNHPLGSQFEREMDATVFFDNVLVPWERVFLLGDVDLCNNVGAATQSMAHSGHQVLTRYVVKAGVHPGAGRLDGGNAGVGVHPARARAGGRVDHPPRHAARVSPGRRSGCSAQPVGDHVPGFSPAPSGPRLVGRTVYPRMVEIIQLLGTSSLMALPAEADFETPLAPAVEHYLATDTTTARDRAQLFHLAWDVRAAPLRVCRCCTSACS